MPMFTMAGLFTFLAHAAGNRDVKLLNKEKLSGKFNEWRPENVMGYYM